MSNAATRAGGYALMVMGPVAGVLVMFATRQNNCSNGDCSEKFTSAGLFGGGVLIAGGFLTGLALILTNDRAEIQVRPGIGASGAQTRVTASNWDSLAGARLHARF